MVKKQYPLVSIIMPVYNAEAYVRESIDSILKQTYSEFELLIVDDGSYDKSLFICQSFFDPRIRILKNNENKGYLKSVNIAFSECKGELITFQDADDFSALDRVEILVKELVADGEVALCGTQCYFLKGLKAQSSYYPITNEEILLSASQGETALFCGASVMFRKGLLTDIGGYREVFNRIGSEDVDWFLRVIEKYKVKNLETALYYYRYNPSSVSKSYSLNPLRYHSADIALDLYRQRQKNGSDILSHDKESVDCFLSSFISAYESDSSLIYKRAGINQLAFGNYKAFFECGKAAISASGWHRSIMLYYISVVPFFILNSISEGRKKRIISFIKRNIL